MVSPEDPNWIFDYPLIDNVTLPSDTFLTPSTWHIHPPFNSSSSINPSVECDGSIADLDGHKGTGSKKRGRAEACSGTSSKACREKLRRDKLNEKFVELASILEPEGPPKTDKAAILVDAVRTVTRLKNEAQKLKDSNSDLHEKIKELKSEKNELRDEKQKLKAEKEKLEQQVNSINTQPSFLAPAHGFPSPGIPGAYPATIAMTQGQPMGNKFVPVMSYPGMAMWPFMPPAAIDTSQDHELHPPVA